MNKTNFKTYLNNFEVDSEKILKLISKLECSTDKSIPSEQKLEFSLCLPEEKNRFRFGWFKIYDPNVFYDIFDLFDYDKLRLKNAINIMKDCSKEFAFGFDSNEPNKPRLKLYFLRLQDHPIFVSSTHQKLNHLSRELSLDYNVDIKEPYLICVDFLKDSNNLKVYTRETKVSPQRIKSKTRIKSLDLIFNSFSIPNLKDVSYSYRFSNKSNILELVSVFFEVEPNIHQELLSFLNKSGQDKEYEALIRPLKKDNSLKYSHIGVNKSTRANLEKIVVYFSLR